MKVSVIIPALNEASNVTACILSVKDQAGKFEIIAADGGSNDETVEIATRGNALVLSATRGRAVQMNAGARHASGDVLLFLHADSRLHPDGLAALRQTLLDPQVAGGTFTLNFDSE